jgi:hypothetical protein
MKKLFCESPVDFYWVQLNLSASLNFAAQHAVAVYIIKDWKQYSFSKQTVAVLIDNCSKTGYIQRENVEDVQDDNIGERIFSLFLSRGNSRLELIIRIKQRTKKNSIYQQASHTES